MNVTKITNDTNNIEFELGYILGSNASLIEENTNLFYDANAAGKVAQAALHFNIVVALTAENMAMEWILKIHNEVGIPLEYLNKNVSIEFYTDRSGHKQVVAVLYTTGSR